ncbi:MAG TPA: hypothetical protein VG755_30040 [Nannocystaceae bacterium]|nr:hypothetical protein [Nannocystaceae bacterium]
MQQAKVRSRRVRQHVNPLSTRFAEPRAVAVSIPAHLGPDAPVDVELGCADAQFSIALARAHPRRFVLGLEIREAVITKVLRRAAGVSNLHIAYCNLAVDLDRVLPERSVDRFHLLFPDPWFKPRHAKRRLLDPELVALLHSRLRDGGELHVATDVYELALDAMFAVDVAQCFENVAGPWRFIRDNPYGLTSRREDHVVRQGVRVWRMRWRKAQPPDASASIVGR